LSELLEHLGTRCIYATHHFDELRLLVADEILYLHRDAAGVSRGASQSLAEFRAKPPTVDAAVTALGALATVLKGGTTASGDDSWFSPAGEGDATSLVLPAESVTARDDGFPCEVVSSSGEVVIARMRGQHVVVPSANVPRGIRFNGEAYVFADGACGRKVCLETQEGKPGCNVIRIRS
jgi:hypothetical protein